MEDQIPGGLYRFSRDSLEGFGQNGPRQLLSHDSHLYRDTQPIRTDDSSHHTTFQYPIPHVRPGHGSTSTQSSFASWGVFSDYSNRTSVASTSTNRSRHSIIPDESLTTCVSRPERARPADKAGKPPQFWCTVCGKGFGSKHDWKRHEEIFQERFVEYWCEMDKKTFFHKKDFTNHHEKSHGCKTCVEFNHAEIVSTKRKSRSAWGCGFCTWHTTNWNERCNHVASHFRDGMDLKKWKHARVILSLLQRPGLYQAWISLLERKKVQNPGFGWNVHSTGRAEAYPFSGRPPQLQDLLEWYTEDQDPVPIVELALEKGLRQIESVSASEAEAMVEPDAGLTIDKRDPNSRTPFQGHIELCTLGNGSADSRPFPSNRTLGRDKALPPVPTGNDPMYDIVSTIGDGLEKDSIWEHFADSVVPDAIQPDPSSMELDRMINNLSNDDFNWTSWLED